MSNAVTILVRAKDEASSVFGHVTGNAQGMSKAVGLAAGAGALAIAGIGVASVKMAADFESSMSEVKTLIPGISDEAFGALRQDVLDLSKEMGIATDQAVPALYQAISAGVPKENVATFLEVASKAAIGGVTDLETAVDGITSVTNAYGRENISAQRAADVMFTAVKNGKTDFDQLSKSLFNVIPTAASLGVSFEDVTSQLAAMTAQGTPTSVATTQIRAALVEASKGGTKLDGAIKELTGKSFAELIKSGKTMPEIFHQLRKSMPEQDFKDLFGSVEAMNAALGVSGPNFGTVSGFMDAAKDSAGAVDEAFSTVSDTANFKIGKALNTLKVMMIEFGSIILPHLAMFLSTVVVPALERFGQWFEDNRPQIEAAVSGVIAILQVLWASFQTGFETVWPLLKRFAEFIYENKPLLVLAIGAIGIAIVMALGPASAVVAGILGLITLIGFMRDHWLEITDGVKDILRGFTGWLADMFFGFLDSKFAWLAVLLGPVGLLVTVYKFRDQIGGAFESIKDKVGGAFDYVAEKVAQIKALIDSIPSPGEAFSGATGAIGGALSGATSWIPGRATGGLVPGPLGAPRLILAHGGEDVRTPAQQASPVPGSGPSGTNGEMVMHLHFHGPVGDQQAAEEWILKGLESLRRHGYRFAS